MGYLYDEKRIKTGRTVERGKPMAPGEFHNVVNVWIRNQRGEWLISKRAPSKHGYITAADFGQLSLHPVG